MLTKIRRSTLLFPTLPRKTPASWFALPTVKTAGLPLNRLDLLVKTAGGLSASFLILVSHLPPSLPLLKMVTLSTGHSIPALMVTITATPTLKIFALRKMHPNKPTAQLLPDKMPRLMKFCKPVTSVNPRGRTPFLSPLITKLVPVTVTTMSLSGPSLHASSASILTLKP